MQPPTCAPRMAPPARRPPKDFAKSIPARKARTSDAPEMAPCQERLAIKHKQQQCHRPRLHGACDQRHPKVIANTIRTITAPTGDTAAVAPGHERPAVWHNYNKCPRPRSPATGAPASPPPQDMQNPLKRKRRTHVKHGEQRDANKSEQPITSNTDTTARIHPQLASNDHRYIYRIQYGRTTRPQAKSPNWRQTRNAQPHDTIFMNATAHVCTPIAPTH